MHDPSNLPVTGPDVVEIAATTEREQRRRRIEVWAAVALLFVLVAGTWTQLTFFGVDSWLFIALFNMNAVFMLVLLFLVTRNVVKLIMERRRNVFGARIRTRLVLVFVSLSLIPTVLMFLAANRVVGRSVDYWFTSQTQNTLEAALEIGQSFYEASADRLKARSESILTIIDEQGIAWGSGAMYSLLATKQQEYGLTVVGLVNDQQKEEWYTDIPFNTLWQNMRDHIDWGHVESSGFESLLWATERADYVVGLLAVDEGEKGYLVTAETIGHGLMSKLGGISKGFEEYTQLKQFKKPLKVSFQLILGVLGMTTVFGAVWFGFRLSKEFTAPILALADGTQRVAKGDLDFRLEDKAVDELALLVQAFNSMAGDLKASRADLTLANARLAEQNEAMTERNHYIETVLDNITTGVITLDASAKLITMNKAACALFATNSDMLRGKSPEHFLPSRYVVLFEEMLSTFAQNPDQHWQRQVDFYIGKHYWNLIIHTVALKGPQGIIAYVVVIEDITELEKMQRMAAWREVARRIAHEIKNPLTPIKLSAQRLERKFAEQVQNPVFSECTDMIVKQVGRMQEMVQEFSAFAKLPEVRVSQGDLQPLLEELVTLFRNSHSEVTWQLHIRAPLPMLAMDAEAMHRALLNILTNAAEAVQKQPTRKVRLFARYNARLAKIRILVVDSGPGLTQEALVRLFEPYFSSKKEGTGLGLAIVKSIINDHRGSVRAVSNRHKGTVMIIDLPVQGEG